MILLVIYPENPNNQFIFQKFCFTKQIALKYTYPFYDLLIFILNILGKIKAPEKSGTFRDQGEAHAQDFFYPPHFQRVLEVIPQLLKKVGPRRIRSAKVTDPKTDM